MSTAFGNLALGDQFQCQMFQLFDKLRRIIATQNLAPYNLKTLHVRIVFFLDNTEFPSYFTRMS